MTDLECLLNIEWLSLQHSKFCSNYLLSLAEGSENRVYIALPSGGSSQ